MTHRFMPHVRRIELAGLLAIAMQEAGLKPRQLAERAGCSYETVNHLLRGENVPSYQMAHKLARGLAMSPADRDYFLIICGYWPWPDISVEEKLALIEQVHAWHAEAEASYAATD